ncbi:MAG: phosphoribosylglycinamide formyltransferase [Chloroflexaceae bacterium]|nr:phosphoribosylglycinamide formyltransferase [Chloroflexaceae bacterium]
MSHAASAHERPRLVICISGSGTNLQAIINAMITQLLPIDIVLVVSNRKRAYGLERAAAAGIPTLYVPLASYRKHPAGRRAYDADLAAQIQPYQPDLIVLAGWMHIFSPAFLDHFPQKVINLHPALPGTFPGVDAIQRAYEAYQQGAIQHSGCMVHYASPEVDAGPVIAQATVPIYPDDTLESFEQRMHATEHGLLVTALQHLFAAFHGQTGGDGGT